MRAGLISYLSRLIARIGGLVHGYPRYHPERHYMRGRGPKTAARENAMRAGSNRD